MQRRGTICAILVEDILGTILLNYIKFGPAVQMSFKDISYLELWRPFGSAEKTICVIFVRGHYQEQFYMIILYLDQWFRCRLKTYYLELWRPFIWPSGTICAILVEAIMRNNSVK